VARRLLLDCLIGAGEQRWRNGKTKRRAPLASNRGVRVKKKHGTPGKSEKCLTGDGESQMAWGVIGGAQRLSALEIMARRSAWRGLWGRRPGRLFTGLWRHGNRLVRSRMGNAGTGVGKPSFLKLPGLPVVPPPFDVNGGRPVPCIIGFRICSAELLFGAEAIRKFVKLYVRLHRRHATDQNDQNPFHASTWVFAGDKAPCTTENRSTNRWFH
jgi:hypothetical protein